MFIDSAISVLIAELLELDPARLPVTRIFRLTEHVRHVLLQIQLPVPILERIMQSRKSLLSRKSSLHIFFLLLEPGALNTVAKTVSRAHSENKINKMGTVSLQMTTSNDNTR
jgi:hypothetical protein